VSRGDGGSVSHATAARAAAGHPAGGAAAGEGHTAVHGDMQGRVGLRAHKQCVHARLCIPDCPESSLCCGQVTSYMNKGLQSNRLTASLSSRQGRVVQDHQDREKS